MAEEINKLVDIITSELNPKQKKVIFRRYGLMGSGRRSTLQEIGNEFDITRERVRQIENQALKKIRKTASVRAGDLLRIAREHLHEKGGAREDELFVNELGVKTGVLSSAGKSTLKNRLRFIFFSSGAPLYFEGDKRVRSFWYLSEDVKNSVHSLIKKTLDAFRGLPRKRILDEKEIMRSLEGTPHYDFLLISRELDVGPFGDLGLVEWAEIRPKNVRDKAYLVLREKSAPMHFSDIAKSIKSLGVSRTPVNVQTVHNELIKDERFTLVGRGMYALKEHGFEPGTISEVIAGLIKVYGPLKSEEVVRLVGERRILKDNTIILNLQNRRNFIRLEDDRYDIRSV